MDTDLLWFYTRLHGLRVTDLMQGPVYGLSTDETDADPRLVPNFHYDDIFGTVLNRFLVQAVAGVPLTVYGEGEQTRGYLNLRDTLQCLALAVDSPPPPGDMRIFNQFTEEFSVNQLAERVAEAARRRGSPVEIRHIKNPRRERERHHYRPAHQGLIDLGFQPAALTDEVIAAMLTRLEPFKARIDPAKFLPRVRWR
jgi:UDP-sulfoquinovose synthase